MDAGPYIGTPAGFFCQNVAGIRAGVSHRVGCVKSPTLLIGDSVVLSDESETKMAKSKLNGKSRIVPSGGATLSPKISYFNYGTSSCLCA